jgi:PAS domain S-box-containing protein
MYKKETPTISNKDTYYNSVSSRVTDHISEHTDTYKKLAYQANLLDIINDAIIAFDLNQKVTYLNPEAELLYGWTEAEALYKTASDILQPIKTLTSADKKQSINLDNLSKGEYIHCHKNGAPFWAECVAKEYFDDDGTKLGYVVVSRDISVRKKAEHSLNYVRERLAQEMSVKERLRTIYSRFINEENVHEVLDEIIETVIEFSNADMGYIHLIDEKSGKIKIMSQKGFNEQFIESYKEILSDKKIYKACKKIKERIIIEDITEDSLFLCGHNIRSILPSEVKTLQFTPLVNHSGQLLGIFSTQYKTNYKLEDIEIQLLDMLAKLITDVVERMQFEVTKELLIKSEKEKNEALQRAIEMKDEFLSLISHEFRTPLTVINSAIQTMELLCRDELSFKAKDFLGKIRQNSYRQLRLVNNLLDITRFNAGQMQVNKENIDIVYLTKSVTDSVQIYAQQKEIGLTFSSTIKSREIGIDEEKYERILLNLLSNAIKFTNRGNSIHVSVSQKLVDKRCMICIQVKDKGIGIPEDKVDIIFENFGQVDNSLSRQAEGFGIGLSLVKLLVKSQDGLITVNSKEGKGSTFNIMFPAKKVKELNDSKTPEASKSSKKLQAPKDLKDPKNSAEQAIIKSTDSRIIQETAVEFSDIYL